MDVTTQSLRRRAAEMLPRLLSQVARDPNSPAHGCWDRHWWHYKIRDFPSVILQQGGYALQIAAPLELDGAPKPEYLRRLAHASALFWNQRACRAGAFEEYYPHEQGYPPLAFSTLAMAKLVHLGAVEWEEIEAGMAVAVTQLRTRFEPQAANQQLAGMAALAWIRKLCPDCVPEGEIQTVLERSLALQDAEGWFPEYDGPDLGYLSVSLDCLWDLHDATGDPRCLVAIDRAVEFISWFVLQAPHHAGMHNSRNTDYLVPYGLVRSALEESTQAQTAADVLHQCFRGAEEPSHFLAAVDERYWCHYTGHSLLRAVALLKRVALPEPSARPPSFAPTMPGSGHCRLHSEALNVLVSGHKGGVVTADWGGGLRVSDFGWLLQPEVGKCRVTHWWSADWVVRASEKEVVVSGMTVPHRELESTPLRHVLLRVASRLLGRRLIQRLKRSLIFKVSDGSLRFERQIRIEQGQLILRDRFDGLPGTWNCIRAPRSSKRHVASADGYHPEDAGLPEGVEMTDEWNRDRQSLIIETRLRPAQT